MKSTRSHSFSTHATIGRTIAFGLVFVAALILPQPLFSQGCQLGFQTGSSINASDINGNPSSPAGKWSDASIIQSGYPCMNTLGDWDGTLPGVGNHVTPNLLKTVTVRSKRDASNLYLDFEVQDQTQNENDYTVTGGSLPLGERIVIQIDPKQPLGAALGDGTPGNPLDYRIEVAHKWGLGFTDQKFFNSSTPPGSSICGQQDWNNTGSFPAAIKVALGTTTIAGGYAVEFLIPLSQIGNPSSDIGIAFAVVNDLGYAASAGVYDVSGIPFPTSLPLNNDGNPGLVDPNDPAGCGNWLQPNQWAGGYFNSPPSDVTISRNPIWWSSDAILNFECSTPGYDYYPGTPCKITVQATLQNSGTTTAVRNLLFLWGEADAGGPLWTFLDLKKGISVPSGSGMFSSILWSPPKGLADHPCVRVYILPATFKPAFDEAAMRAMSNAADATVTLLESTYQLGTQHWAQKNITRMADGTQCPNPTCNVGVLQNHADIVATSSGARPKETGHAFSLHLVPEAEAQTVPGNAILMPARELEQFRKDNVIVQIRSFGYSKIRSAKRPTYNFVEPIGGLLQLIPVAMIQKKNVNLQFNVTNPGKVARTIFLKVDTLVPPGLPPFEVGINTGPQDYGPGETKTIKGSAGTNIVGVCLRLPGFGGTFFVLGGVLFIGLFAYRPRRKKNAGEPSQQPKAE